MQRVGDIATLKPDCWVEESQIFEASYPRQHGLEKNLIINHDIGGRHKRGWEKTSGGETPINKRRFRSTVVRDGPSPC